MSVPEGQKRTRVYVDAKILNRHDTSAPHPAYVGYVIEGSESGVREEVAEESDDAEVLAVLFALEKLKGRPGLFAIVCDHESVVSEANREDEPKNQSEVLRKLRSALRETGPSIVLEALLSNPAHGVVTEYVNKMKEGGGQTPDV